MFTGLVSGTGTVSSLRRSGPDAVVTVVPAFSWEDPLALGESVCVSGTCLTVTRALDGGAFEAFASAETLALTSLAAGRRVNLERALRLCDRLGGHLVSGHVDGPAVLARKARDGRSARLTFTTAPELMRYVAPKGSVCLDGVSLTVNDVARESFGVNVIPQTLSATTLDDLKPGDRANLEVDLLARYVEALIPGKDGPAGLPDARLLELLARHSPATSGE
ncbi:MAG: riboflavin synthase [Deltaproteobacteria bacterium]|jgi:riboflavin synthase|nr:riboflavin synthase [Deltaproteobacteria bacterium]